MADGTTGTRRVSIGAALHMNTFVRKFTRKTENAPAAAAATDAPADAPAEEELEADHELEWRTATYSVLDVLAKLDVLTWTFFIVLIVVPRPFPNCFLRLLVPIIKHTWIFWMWEFPPRLNYPVKHDLSVV